MQYALPVELTVILKDDDSRFRKKSLVYERMALDECDPAIQSAIADARAEYKGPAESITIKATLVIR